MRVLLIIFFLFSIVQVCEAQEDSAEAITDILNFQQELKKEYKGIETSPLQKEEREAFTQHKFFPIKLIYRVEAKFIRTPHEKIFIMPTTGNKKKEYVKYGEALFSLMGKEYKLSLYQSIDLAAKRQFRNYIFVPFHDATNGKETYGGGRYIDLTIPKGDSILIDFNKAYHPYCAYTKGYNCPIPPKENYLPIKVEAGIRF